jgi:hypothetical protein
MLTVTFTMVSGKTIKLTDLENTPILTEQNMRDTGLTISNMDKEKKSGQMVPSTKVIINSVKRMDSASSYGLIDHPTKATS